MFAVRSQGRKCGKDPLDDEESKWEVSGLIHSNKIDMCGHEKIAQKKLWANSIWG